MNTRKTLVNEYKQKKPRIGIFQIRNTVNGKIYLDSSPNLDTIWNRHLFELKLGGHRNKALQAEWKAFGEANFVFEILSEMQQDEDKKDYKNELKTLEAMFMDELAPYEENGYHRKPT